MARTILVTGGAGFIGCNFVHYWLEAHPEDRIVVLDALTYAGNLESLEPIWNDSRFAFHPGLIQDRVTVEGIFQTERPTHVLNFAAESHNDRSMIDPGNLIQTNVYGVSVLLEACHKYGIERFLHVSTDEVYGEIGSGAFRETDPLEPRTLYSAAKTGGEMQVRAHRIAYGIPTLITRGSNTFGPYQFPEKILPFFITRAMHDKKLPVYGSGSQVRDWIYVRDHCTGIALVLENGVLGEVYNLGGGNERQNIEVTHLLLGLLGKPESLIKHIEDPRGDAHDKRYALDTTKLRALGWKPDSSFEEALDSTVRWYNDNQSWWRKIVKSQGYIDFISGFYGRYLGDDL